MVKDDQQRITDTLIFLKDMPLVPWAVREKAHKLASDYVNEAFPNPDSPAYQQLSQSLSLGFHLMSDSNQHRRMTRALLLLWKAMNHFGNRFSFTMPFQNIGQINQGMVQRLLTSYIYKACCLAECIYGGNTGATHVITQAFRSNPLMFLQDNKLFVYGSARLNGGLRNTLVFGFAYNPSRDRYEFSAGCGEGTPDCEAPQAGMVNVEVESVTALHWIDRRYVPRPPGAPPPVLSSTNFNQMTGIQLSGDHPMVTTQFTGCAFCMTERSGKMYCTHVSPSVPGKSNNTEGPLLARRVMQTSGAFANAGGARVRVYGRNLGHPPNRAGYDIGPIGTLGSTHYMTVVGWPGGTSYNIYSQTIRDNRIAEVKQIF
jgi:hypothetical protein